MISSMIPTEMEGFIYKKSPALFKGWQRRYIQLRNRNFTWYKINKKKKKKEQRTSDDFSDLDCNRGTDGTDQCSSYDNSSGTLITRLTQSHKASCIVAEANDFSLKTKYSEEVNEESIDTKKSCGTVNFDLFKCFIEIDPKNSLCFNLNFSGIKGKHFQFRAHSFEQSFQWQRIFKYQIQQSEGYIKNLLCQPYLFKKKPWKFSSISEKQLFENAKTGDILLFKGNQFHNYITRAITWSKYDHVAMVIKFQSQEDEVFFIEAVSNLGVSYNKWSRLRKHVGPNKFYKKIVYRSIDTIRDDPMFDKVE